MQIQGLYLGKKLSMNQSFFIVKNWSKGFKSAFETGNSSTNCYEVKLQIQFALIFLRSKTLAIQSTQSKIQIAYF